MATLIQSKQIEGVVTASVIEGTFTVQSGSVNLEGASGVTGSFSGSFVGDGSQLTFNGTGLVSGSTQITISQTTGYTAFSSSIASSIAGITDTDNQTLSFNQVSKRLTISDGNTVDLSSLGGGGGGGGSSIWTTGSNFYKVSSNLQVTGSFSATSLTGSIDYSNLTNAPSGIISGSGQLPSGLVSQSAQTIIHLRGTNVFSGSGQLPDGLVSSSTQIPSLLPDGVISGSGQLPSGIFSGSGQLPSGIFSGSGQLPDGIVSSSTQIPSLLPDGVVSGSTQITNGSNLFSGSIVAGTNITITSGSGNIIISSSAGGGVSSFNDLTDVPAGLISGSGQLPDGIVSQSAQISSFNTFLEINGDGVVSSSQQIIDSLPNGVISGSGQLPSGIFSSSAQLPSGIISGSGQLPSGLVSESAQTIANLNGTNIFSGSLLPGANVTITSGSGNFTITAANDGTSDFTNLINVPDGLVSSSNQLTSSYDTRYLNTNGDGVVSGSVLRTLDGTGVFSGSGQLPDGIVSSSTQIPSLLPDGVISGSGQLPSGIFSGSGQLPSGLVSESAQIPSLLPDGVISGSGQLPSGIFSGSGQLPDGIVSASNQIPSLLPAGVVSGSEQITNGSNILSGSLVAGTNITITSGSGNIIISASAGGGVSSYNDLTDVPSGIVSSSNQTIAHTSGSGIISSSEQLTSTFLEINGDGVVSSSQQIIDSLPSGVISGSGQLPDGLVSESAQVVSLLPDGVVSGSTQITNGSGIFSGSLLPGEGITIASGSGNISISASFDGNRTVSNTNLPSGIYNNNFGTSGSIQNFIEAVFFPNTAPSISTGNQTILEFSGSGATIVTLSATDAEGQSLTFGTASAYTDDLVRVASDGEMTLNALATSASFNTDSVGGGHGHLVTVTATDTFDAVTEKDIYIIVTPNEAPKFRETSISGNVITSVTANLNENSADDTLVKRVFFTDAEGDTITITTSSIDNEHFDITIYGTYLDIRQNTGSLDYDQQTSYTFSITASDEHYENSQDSDSRTFLPVTINVTDNNAPTVNNQVVGSINENSSNGTVVGTVSVSDSEGDSVSAPFFQLHKLYLDGSEVATGSYGGTSQATDPHENAFEINSGNRQITRKNSVYLNSDLVNRYDYRVKVKDNFNAQISSASVVTININDDVAATLTDNWSAGPYIKESELDGATIKTTDYGSTQADYNANQSGTWSSSNNAISINSSGNLSLNVDLSGSLTSSGDTIDSTITFTNTFGTTTTDALSVSVVANDAPTISFTNQTGNFNTNLATEDTTMVSMSVSDTESDTPFSASLTGTDASSLKLKYVGANSASIGIQAASDLSAATYNYNVKITDNFGKSRNYNGRSFTVASADTGTLGGDTTSYIIESAISGAVIRDASGFNAGNQSQMTVSYSPNYGSQVVQGSSWASSNPAVAINTSGQLSLALNISGSDTGSGDDIISTISFQDQYGNSGTGTVTVNVFANQAPTATFTDQSANFETDLAIAGATMVSMSITDTESDTPFSASLTGTNASDLQLKYVGSNSASVGIQAASSLAAGTYNYNVKVTDNFNKSRTYSGRSFTIVQSADYGKTYVYRSDYGSDAGLSSNYNAVMGAQTVSSDTPPEVTAYTANATSPYRLISSSLGDASLSLAGGKTATRVAILSGSDLDTIISESNPFTMGNTAEQYLIIAPSGSDMVGIPTSMTDGFGDNTVGRYVMAIKADGGSWGQESSTVHLLDTSGSINGYDKHFVIGRNGHNSAASVEIRIIEASGSLPS